jgi:tRNA modification GTPase
MNELPGYANDTIVAAATPAGTGGVAIVRLSGPEVETIATAMIGSLPVPRRAAHRTFVGADKSPIDSGIALYFPAPNSFTGESVLELHGHGGPVVVGSLIEAAVHFGARRAVAGEFSKRAFLNDKLDLVQAEAIADLIDSGTQQAARAALRSLSGEFSSRIEILSEQLIQLRLYVEAAIDFPEEEIDFLSDRALRTRIDDCAALFDEILPAAAAGRLLTDGYQLVIVGKPNAGKSSLLNLLSGQDAAIVTDIAGTTRDILRERINIDGLSVELVDTAGLRDDPDRIEAEGIRRARAALAEADAALWIQDASALPDATIPTELPAGLPVIVVRNKIDLCDPHDVDSIPGQVLLSAKTGAGLDALKTAIKTLAGYREHGEGTFSARQRHIDALNDAKHHFTQGVAALDESRSGELLAEELRLSLQALGEIVGEFSGDDLLGRIFLEFCIGK